MAQQAPEAIQHFGDPYLAAVMGDRPPEWGLLGIQRLLAELGDPHTAYPIVHITGTKGKGSTAAMIAQCLSESGLRTGLYTSPHLEDWRERIQVDRAWIAEDQLSGIVEDILPYAEKHADRLTAFEVTTALALWHFAREGCEAAVLEVGLGGQYDATSIVKPAASVITSISLDHTSILGSTIAEIAQDKAMIIRAGVPAISAPQVDAALQQIEARAREIGAPLTVVGRDWQVRALSASWDGSAIQVGRREPLKPYHVGMPGTFQVENAAVALATLEALRQQGLPITEQGLVDGLTNVVWPGRMELVQHDPLVVIDGAHNTYSVGRAIESLLDLAPDDHLTLVFGCMVDKDIKGMLSHVVPNARHLIVTRAATPRAATTAEVAALARAVGGAATPSISEAPTVADAVDLALLDAQTILILGSLAVAGEARTAILGSVIQ